MTINITWITICVVSLSIEVSFSQADLQWVARYNGIGNSEDRAIAIFVDNLSNAYVTGYSRSGSNAGTEDYLTIKYNPLGDTLWVKRYNGPGNEIDYANAITVDEVGNIYVTGYSTGNGTHVDYATIKYDSSGIQQWIQRYNGSANGYDYANDITVDGFGNVYVTGYTDVNISGTDYCTIKYNPSGDTLWVRSYSGSASFVDVAKFIEVDNKGNTYVAGYSSGIGSDYDIVTIKYDSSGTLLWDQRYNGPGNFEDRPNAFVIDNCGNVYIAGRSYGGSTDYDFVIIKYNSDGIQQFVRRYNGPANYDDAATCLSVDSSSNIYAAGYSNGIGSDKDYAVIKYDSAGVQQWIRRYNGPGNSTDYATAISNDINGNVYITGYSYGLGTLADFATITYSLAGDSIWTHRYNGPSNGGDFTTSMAIDRSGNIYVTGRSYDLVTGVDYVTLKYSSITGINDIIPVVPSQYRLFQNYPNPFNPSTTIEYEIASYTYVQLKIFDVLGRHIMDLVNKDQQPGRYSVMFNADGLSSGIFIYQLWAGNFISSKKLILIQ